MRLLFIVILLMSTQIASAQVQMLPVDERGVHTFMEVSGFNAAPKEISVNIKRFFKANSKALKLRSSKGDTAFYGTGKLVLAKNTSGIGHPSAEVNFNVSLELKTGKYRLIFTDYILTPYERDRYANFVTTTTKYRLEDRPGKLNRAEWENNMKMIVAESAKLSGKLKSAMNSTPSDVGPETKKPAAVSTTNWR